MPIFILYVKGKDEMKKTLALLLALVMVLALTACGGSNNAEEPADEVEQAAEEATETVIDAAADAVDEVEAESYTVGICQLAPHVALDAATQGFKDALTEEFGDMVTFDEQNAGGEDANCATIIDGFVANDVDLILANATAPLQRAAAATDTIPVLGTSVTDYATALGIDDWTGTVGGNVSGTSDLAPLDQQAEMLHELFPDKKNVGLLYCSGEPNSIYQIGVVQTALEGMGYTCTAYPFTDVNDLPSVAQSACDGSDVIYVPTDNTAANNTEAIANVVLAEKVPVVAGEEGICSGCGCVTLSISYYDLGVMTGQMAAQILKGEADISEMPVQFAPQVTKKYNAANCEALGITVPDDYVAIEAE